MLGLLCVAGKRAAQTAQGKQMEERLKGINRPFGSRRKEKVLKLLRRGGGREMRAKNSVCRKINSIARKRLVGGPVVRRSGQVGRDKGSLESGFSK